MHYVLLENFTLLHKSDLYKHCTHTQARTLSPCYKFNQLSYLWLKYLQVHFYFFTALSLSIHECSPEIKWSNLKVHPIWKNLILIYNKQYHSFNSFTISISDIHAILVMEFIFLKQFEFFYNQIITVYTYTFIANTFPITIVTSKNRIPLTR